MIAGLMSLAICTVLLIAGAAVANVGLYIAAALAIAGEWVLEKF